MHAFVDALAAELVRIRERQHADAVRAAHVESALRLARQGVAEGILRATLESKGVIILAGPGAPREGPQTDGRCSWCRAADLDACLCRTQGYVGPYATKREEAT